MNKKRISVAVGAVMASAIFLPAFAATLEGHFSGHADHSGGVPGVYTAGESYTAYMTLDTVQPDTWYPWDPAKEYTAVISTTVVSYNVIPLGGGMEQALVDFGDASVSVYEDDGTPADFANPATFMDGVLVLSGIAGGMLGSRLNIFGLPYDVTGTVVFTGGGGLSQLLGCSPDGLLMNDFIDFQLSTPPPGYEEAYDADWKCTVATDIDESTWGHVKGLYR